MARELQTLNEQNKLAWDSSKGSGCRCRGRYSFLRGCSYCGNGAAGIKIMLSDFVGADKVYIACGYTDLRRRIDGLAAMVQQEFQLDPFTNTLFFVLRQTAGPDQSTVLGKQ